MVWGFGSKKKTPAEKEIERQKKLIDKEFKSDFKHFVGGSNLFIVEHFDSLYDPVTKSHEKWFKKTLEAIKKHQNTLIEKSSVFLQLFYENVDILIQLFVNIFIEYNILIQLIKSLHATSYYELKMKLKARTTLLNKKEAIYKNILEHQIQPFFIKMFMTEKMRKTNIRPSINEILTDNNKAYYNMFKLKLKHYVNMCFNLNDKFEKATFYNVKKVTFINEATPLYQFITRCKSKIERIFKFNMANRNMANRNMENRIKIIPPTMQNKNPPQNNGSSKRPPPPPKKKKVVPPKAPLPVLSDNFTNIMKQNPLQKTPKKVVPPPGNPPSNVRSWFGSKLKKDGNPSAKYGPVGGGLYDSVSLRF